MTVREAIFSHSQVGHKNELVIAIVDYLCRNEPGLAEDMQPILSELTTLSNSENAKVALRARQVRRGVGVGGWGAVMGGGARPRRGHAADTQRADHVEQL